MYFQTWSRAFGHPALAGDYLDLFQVLGTGSGSFLCFEEYCAHKYVF